MTPGRPDRHAVERRLIALRRSVSILRRHAGCTPRELRSDVERRWAIEHGLQLPDRLDDFEEFARHIERWFAESPGT